MAIDVQELRTLKQFAIHLARESGAIIKKYFRTQIAVEKKGDNSPVTIADRLAEEKIRDLIQKEFPDHGIIGEEFGTTNESARFTWCIDPLDGTRSFIHGGFDFGSLIAFLENRKTLFGIIHQPVVGELMIGDHISTKLNDVPVKIRPCHSLSQAVMLTTDVVSVGRFQNTIGFQKLMRQVQLCRTWGNCYGYALVAAGFADIMIDPIMAPWDIMALIPIIRGAGGIITDYHGGDPEQGTSIVASSPPIHAAVIDTLRSVESSTRTD